MNWGPAGNCSEDSWGQHSPSLWWRVPVCYCLRDGGFFRPIGALGWILHCGVWPTCFPPLWGTEPGWLREVLRETFRAGRSCLSPLKAHPNAVSSSCCSPMTQRTLSVSAPLSLICGRVQNILKIYSQKKAFLVTLGCSKSEGLLDWYGFLRRCSESDCDG